MDSQLFSEQEKEAAAYRMCVLGATGSGVASGLMVGRWVGAAGLLSGAAVGAVLGLVVGLRTCPRLAEPIKQKLFTKALLSEHELDSAAKALADIAQLPSRSEAIRLVALIHATAPQVVSLGHKAGLPPAMAAAQLLSQRA
jgi:hypothetical protein